MLAPQSSESEQTAVMRAHEKGLGPMLEPSPPMIDPSFHVRSRLFKRLGFFGGPCTKSPP